MAFLTTEIDGVEYGAASQGARGWHSGLFSRLPDGSWQQHRGTAQTPSWKDETRFRRWVLRETRAERALARENRQPLSAAAQRAAARYEAEQRAAEDSEMARYVAAGSDPG